LARGGERDRTLIRELLRPYPDGEMMGYPVSPAVNSTRGMGPELIVEAPLNSV
jgi:putative SOS response-associated peptidase YedK